MEDSKPWFASRTIWANLIAAVATIGTVAGVDLGMTGEEQASLVAGILAVVNIFLRLTTKTAIKGKGDA